MKKFSMQQTNSNGICISNRTFWSNQKPKLGRFN
ncbi:hypothetical protein Ahy_A10g047337 isoform C [Arachis hypogaea]|uniref:Uncharacterized protein n=1 Tax=Arachis hypogaea TaxID=3818 RepID=A0A445B2E1_ARAHY|nr:hypothetical protein Ahy_A10g047337 isoform C [Arachis hypogaea]